ncbi:MAG TPA: TM2 domain-containing protein [Lachnospiraceae bacterium]|nr:TM2 domain-containing protein [Lachnospiraceae bacterium]
MSEKVCAYCGAPINASDEVCSFCFKSISARDVGTVRQVASPINSSWPIKSKTVAGILAIFFGCIGIHKFYLGKVGMGVLYLVFCWTAIPFLISFFEGIRYLCMNSYNFQMQYHVRIIE